MQLGDDFIAMGYSPVRIPPEVDTTVLASVYDDAIVSFEFEYLLLYKTLLQDSGDCCPVSLLDFLCS